MNHKELKKGYIKLYEQMMKYIWPVYTVELLAELEISVCNIFPIMTDVRNNFNRLQSSVFQDIKQDDKLKDAFDKFSELIQQEVSFANITFVEK